MIDDEDNEFAFLSSLPEFATLNSEAQSSLSTLLCEALTIVPSDDSNGGGDDDNDTTEYEFDDPELWERCADACDALYDRVNDYITAEQRSRRGGIGEDDDNDVLSAINIMKLTSILFFGIITVPIILILSLFLIWLISAK